MGRTATNDPLAAIRIAAHAPIPFQVDIEIAWNSKTVWAASGNISRQGMFIEVD